MEFITCLNYAIGIQEVRRAVGLFIIISLVIVLPVYAYLVNIYRAKREARKLLKLDGNFLPPQELLDAGGGPTSKRFAELYIKMITDDLP